MKRLLFVIAVLLAIQGTAQTVWDGTADQSWYDGSQSSFDISTPEQLAGLAQLVNGGNAMQGKTINLIADIWLNAEGSLVNNWIPIGGNPTAASELDAPNYFAGVLNGNFHKIYNMYCSKPDYYQAGLVGALRSQGSPDGTIKSVVMVNPVVRAKGAAGALVGVMGRTTAMWYGTRVHFNQVINADIYCTHNHAGAVVGSALDVKTYTSGGALYMMGNIATGTVIGNYAGGIVGNGYQAEMPASYFYGTVVDVNGGTNYGGLSGTNNVHTNNSCNNFSNITGGNGFNGTLKTFEEMQAIITLLTPCGGLSDNFDASIGYCAIATENCGLNFDLPVYSLITCDATCAVPLHGTVTNIGPYSADISWLGTGNFEIEYGPAATFVPTGTPQYVETGNTVSLSNLTPETSYAVAVRRDCGGDYSSWTTYHFTTAIPCEQPTALAVSNATTTTIDLSWTGPVNGQQWNIEWGAPGFVAGTGDELGSGTASTNFFQMTGLDEATGYRVAVQADCGSTDGTSQWTYINCGTTANETFGNGIWHGYVYNSPESCTFASYLGMVFESEQFDRNTSSAWTGNQDVGADVWAGTAPLDNFSVRYKMTKTFPCGNYTFTIGHDDRTRLSIDGGQTWLITNDWGGSSCCHTISNPTPVYFDGSTPVDLVFEFYEGGAGAQAKFSYAAPLVGIILSDIDAVSANATFNSGEAWNIVVSITAEDDPSEPQNAIDVQNNITVNPHSISGLTPATQYWVYVQTDCGGLWNSANFTTVASCPQPTGVAYNFGTHTLTWTEAGTMTEWQIKVSTTALANPSVNVADVLNDGMASGTPELPITGLQEGNTYHFYVRADCQDGYFSYWTHYQITLAYCTPSPSSTDNPGISEVVFTVNSNVVAQNTQAQTYYGDFTSIEAVAFQGGFLSVQIDYGHSYTYHTRVWIDWNNNYSFDDPEDLVFNGESSTSNGNIITANILIPAGATPGSHRLRLGGADSQIPGPCYTGSYGSFEDYTLMISPASDCMPPLGLTANAVTHEAATISWTALENAVSFTVEYGPTGSFTPGDGNANTIPLLTDNYADLSGLTERTDYTVAVKTDCGADGESIWMTVNFVTTAVETYGDGIWHGYVYNTPARSVSNRTRFIGTAYLGFVTEQEQFDRSPSSGWTGETPVLETPIPEDKFFARYKMTQTFPCGNYVFQMDADDFFRLSLDGRQTWLPTKKDNTWTSETSLWWSNSCCGNDWYTNPVFLNGEQNLDLEYFEWEGGQYLQFHYADQPLSITVSSNSIRSTSANITFGTGDSWNVKVSTASIDPATDLGEMEYPNVTDITYTLENLSPATLYYVYAQASCGSLWSTAASFTTLAACETPTALSVSNITGSSANFKWTAPIENAISYEIKIGEAGFSPEDGPTAYTIIIPDTFLLLSEETLTEITDYTIAVRTLCGDGQSEWITLTFRTIADEIYGNGEWNGYVYTSPSTDVPANRFGTYAGKVTEPAQFTREDVPGAWTGATANWLESAPSDKFAVRYKMTYDFPCGTYNITLPKVDDAARLSIDGGQTWLANLCQGSNCGSNALWNTTSYKNGVYTATVYLEGSTNLVLEFYEATGNASIGFQFTVNPVSITFSNPTPTSINLSFSQGSAWNIKVSTTPLDDPATDFGDVWEDATTNNPYALTGLTPETNYYIYAQLGCGSVWSNTPYTTIPACPVPINLTTANIGADTATLNWEHYGMTGWNLKVSTSPLTDLENAVGNVFDGPVSTNLYKLTDLDPRTQYYWYVQSDCGSAWSAEAAFRTTQMPESLPFACSFESPADNSGWDFNNGTQTNKWMNGSAVNNGGANALYISNNNNNNAYSIDNTSYVYAFRTVNIPATANQLEMMFDWKGTGESSYDVGRAFLVPLSADITAGNANGMTSSSNPIPSGWIDIGQGNLQSNNTWNTRVTLFAAPAAGLYNIVFFWKNDGSVGTQPPVAIDNVSLKEYTCPVVTSLSVPATSITTHAANITWTAGGTETEWGVKYCPSSTDPELVPEDIVYTNSYSLSGLESETAYNVYVRARCNADADASRWQTVTFQTLVECEKPVNLQISGITATDAMVSWNPNEDITEWGIRYFETGTDPDLATEYAISDTFYSIAGMLTPATLHTVQVRSHCVGSNSIWVIANFVTMPDETYGDGEWNGYVYSAPSEHQFINFLGSVNEPAQFSRNKTPTSLQAGPWTGENPNFIGTPPSDAFSARYRMTYNFTGSNYMFILDADDHFRLSVDGGQTWLPFTRDNTTTTSPDNWSTGCCSPWHSATVAITGSNDLVLEFYEGGGGAYLDFSFIDMDCQAPTNVAATNVTTTGAEISWTGIDEAVDYTVEVCAPGETPGNGNIYSNPNATSSVSVTGLSAATAYTIYVKSNCGSTESAWASADFITECEVMGLPFSETFDSYQGTSYSVQGILPTCWAASYPNASYAPHVCNSNLSGRKPHSGSNAISFYAGNTHTNGENAYLIMPALATPIANTTVSLWYIYENATQGTLSLGYITGAQNDMSTYTSVVTLSGDVSYQQFTFDFSTAAQDLTNATYIVVNWNKSGTWYTASVDDINITANDPVTCTAPTGVTVSAITQTAATVSWTASPTATSYEVEYKLAASPTWNPADMVTTSATSTGLPTLTAETQYDVRVRSICDDGESTYATASFTTLANPTVCNVPTALNHNTVTDVSATITWTAGGNETQWQIAWKQTANSNWNNSAIVTNEPSHNLSELDAATDYDVRVRAICAAGDTSNWTAIHNFTTLPAPSSCIAPVVSVTDVESTSASVTWTAGGTETQWILEYGIGSSYDASIAVSTQPHPLNGLQPNTTYNARMKAVCSATDTSYYSNVATFTTLQITCNAPDNLHQTTVDEHSISITWTPVNGETEWTVSWAISGSTGNVPVTGLPEYTLTDLLSDTVYQICVRAICSDAVQSTDACIDVRTIGINDIPLASGVKLYPNPASEQLTIEMESRFNTVEVTSTLGQVVYRASLTEKTKVIDVTGYSAGMYYVRLQGDAGTVTKKFVKR